MKFNLDSVENFEVRVSAIYYKNNLVEEELKLHNFSLDNSAIALSFLKIGRAHV